MKKLIGILGVAISATVLFMNANTVENSPEIDLASLLSINEANAECDSGPDGTYQNGVCDVYGTTCWVGGVSWQQDCSTAYSN